LVVLLRLLAAELAQDLAAHLVERPNPVLLDVVHADHVPATIGLERTADLALSQLERRSGEFGLRADRGEHAVARDRAEIAAVLLGHAVGGPLLGQLAPVRRRL